MQRRGVAGQRIVVMHQRTGVMPAGWERGVSPADPASPTIRHLFFHQLWEYLIRHARHVSATGSQTHASHVPDAKIEPKEPRPQRAKKVVERLASLPFSLPLSGAAARTVPQRTERSSRLHLAAGLVRRDQRESAAGGARRARAHAVAPAADAGR